MMPVINSQKVQSNRNWGRERGRGGRRGRGRAGGENRNTNAVKSEKLANLGEDSKGVL